IISTQGRRMKKTAEVSNAKICVLAYWVLSLSVALLTCSLALASDKKPHWVGTWATSPMLGDVSNAPPSPGFDDATLRQIVHVSIGGKQLRVRLSNAFGTTPLTISATHVAIASTNGSIRPGSDKALTFSGQTSVTIPPGALIYFDPIDFDLAPLSDLAVT